eukprot:2976220-Rhodomonas_salina.2
MTKEAQHLLRHAWILPGIATASVSTGQRLCSGHHTADARNDTSAALAVRLSSASPLACSGPATRPHQFGAPQSTRTWAT